MIEKLSAKNFREEFIFRTLKNIAFEYFDLVRQHGTASVDDCSLEDDFAKLANIISFVVFKSVDFGLGLNISNCEWVGRIADKNIKLFSDFVDRGLIPAPMFPVDYNPYSEAFYRAAENAGVKFTAIPFAVTNNSGVHNPRLNNIFLRQLSSIFASVDFKRDVRVRLEKTNDCLEKCLSHTREMMRIRAARVLKMNFYLDEFINLSGTFKYERPQLSSLFAVFINKLSKISPERHGVAGYINFSRLSRGRGLYFHCILFLDVDFLRTDNYVINFLRDMWLDLLRRSHLHGGCDALPVYQHDDGLRYISGRGPKGLARAEVSPGDGGSARHNAKVFRGYLEYLAFSNFIMCVKLEPRVRLFSTSVLARPASTKSKSGRSPKGCVSSKPVAELDLNASLV